MAVAHMKEDSDKIWTKEAPTDIRAFKDYLKSIEGSKILTFEEQNGAQWLYTELRPFVDKIIVCETYRNHLLKEGPKTDKIDAQKLVRLMRAGFLKEVYHCSDDFIHIRKITTGYRQLVKESVRLQVSVKSLMRSEGNLHYKSDKVTSDEGNFVLSGMQKRIEYLDEEKKRYLSEFRRLVKKHKSIKALTTLPGISDIIAVNIAALIVDPKRFKTKGQLFSYAGLIKHERISGGVLYYKKKPRHSAHLKYWIKLAAATILRGDRHNSIKDYYDHLIEVKKYEPHNARHQLARYMLTLVWGLMKSGGKYNATRNKEKRNVKQSTEQQTSA